MQIEVRLLHPDARVPRQAHPGDAGVDLSSVEAVDIPPGERRDVGTGIAIAIPPGYGGFVQPRSGLAFNNGLMLVNSPGLIDTGYRGEIRVCLYNTGTTTFRVDIGERIAQLVIHSVEEPAFMPVAELSATVRAAKGFGSSGR
jgi:dUTP pyrophosphatase